MRASHGAGELRRTTLTYAAGIAIVQVLWLLALLLPSSVFGFAVVALVIAEISVPIVAEKNGTTPWHPHHITQRYGLFTLFLLGESLLASSNAIISAVQEGEHVAPLGSAHPTPLCRDNRHSRRRGRGAGVARPESRRAPTTEDLINEEERPFRDALLRSGGSEGTRTPDPLHAMQVRYQLRHRPRFAASVRMTTR